MSIKHYLQFSDFNLEQYQYLFKRTKIIKERFKRYETYHPLRDRTLAMVFEKNSTRTRVSFEAGMGQLGGTAMFITNKDSQMSRGEPIEDQARVISRMVDIVMIRTFEQANIVKFAEYSRVPVINEYHPCQVLADIYTFFEHRHDIAGKTVVWIGDANNMFYTWLEAASIFKFNLHVCSPKGYAVDEARLNALADPADSRQRLKVFDKPIEAAKGAHLINTDVWTSMGWEDETADRASAFAGFTVDKAMMSVAAPDALFMHCLPAHRGEEVAAEVIDGPQSVVWDEAENRLHAQKALLEYLLIGEVF
jgi:ornithine carbamoyltransferase